MAVTPPRRRPPCRTWLCCGAGANPRLSRPCPLPRGTEHCRWPSGRHRELRLPSPPTPSSAHFGSNVRITVFKIIFISVYVNTPRARLHGHSLQHPRQKGVLTATRSRGWNPPGSQQNQPADPPVRSHSGKVPGTSLGPPPSCPHRVGSRAALSTGRCPKVPLPRCKILTHC